MKLLFLLQECGDGPGGVVTMTRELCQCWSEDDKIEVLINRNHPASVSQICGEPKTTNITVHRLRIPLPSDLPVRNMALKVLLRPVRWLWLCGYLIYLVGWLRIHRIEGVLSHNGGWPGGELNRLAIYAAWLARVPDRVLVIHNLPWRPSSILLAIYRLYGWVVSSLATRLITVSNFCKDSLREIAGLRSVSVIYNGISAANPRINDFSLHNNSPAWEKKYPTIGFVGEMHPRKGVHILVDALCVVGSPCELVLIGDGDRTYIEQIRRAVAASKHPVHFLGFRGDVWKLYQWMDIVVLPSVMYESFGMVILEAMRAGKPVICSDFSGMKEVVVDGKTGVVVPAGDVHALTKAIEWLLRDKDLACRMGESGRMRLEAAFSAHAMVKRYVGLFHPA